MPLDPSLLDQENPSSRSVNRLRGARKNIRPWDDFEPIKSLDAETAEGGDEESRGSPATRAVARAGAAKRAVKEQSADDLHNGVQQRGASPAPVNVVQQRGASPAPVSEVRQQGAGPAPANGMQQWGADPAPANGVQQRGASLALANEVQQWGASPAPAKEVQQRGANSAPANGVQQRGADSTPANGVQQRGADSTPANGVQQQGAIPAPANGVLQRGVAQQLDAEEIESDVVSSRAQSIDHRGTNHTGSWQPAIIDASDVFAETSDDRRISSDKLNSAANLLPPSIVGHTERPDHGPDTEADGSLGAQIDKARQAHARAVRSSAQPFDDHGAAADDAAAGIKTSLAGMLNSASSTTLENGQIVDTFGDGAQTSTISQRGANTSSNGVQERQQRGATGCNNGAQESINGVQLPNQRGAAALSPPSTDQILSTTNDAKGGNSGVQDPVAPRLQASCTPLQPALHPVNASQRVARHYVAPRSSPNSTPLQQGAGTPSKGVQLPTSKQQLEVIVYLAEKQQETGLGYTSLVRKIEISERFGISANSLKSSIKRLRLAGLLDVVNTQGGRGADAGAVYRVAPSILEQLPALKGVQENARTGCSNRVRQQGAHGGSSSRFINRGTTTSIGRSDKILAQQFQMALERFDLEHLLGASDLMDVWRDGNHDEPADLIQSTEHMAFFLRTVSKDIVSPKAFAVSKLRKGWYGRPVGFKSQATIIEEAKIEARRQEALESKLLRKRAFEADVSIWLETLDSAERVSILRERAGDDYAYIPPAAQQRMLANHFATSNGLFEFIVTDPATDGGEV